MYMITKEIEFDAGHRVPLHASKCKNPHGHRYRVEVGIAGELITEGPESGMVKDFSNVKEALNFYVHDRYDHAFIVHDKDEHMKEALLIQEDGTSGWNWKVVVVPFIPTAECLAKSIYDDLSEELDVVYVRVWETPTSTASYTEV